MRKELWLVVVLGLVVPALTAKGVVWDFEKDECDWRPRVSTVDLRRLSSVGATETSRACLQVTGTATTNSYNYALSDRVPMQGGQWYRLTGWVRVDMLGPGDPMPYFKCEFVPKDSTKTLGIVVTSKYNDTKMGTWQELSCQFEAPVGAVAGIVALEKGTKSSTEIRALVDDVRLEALSETSIYRAIQRSQPARLAGRRSRRASPAVPDQRSASRNSGRPFRQPTLVCGRKSSTAPTAWSRWTRPSTQASSSDPGQLWQRSVGNAMPYLAMAYRLTGQTKYLEAAEALGPGLVQLSAVGHRRQEQHRPGGRSSAVRPGPGLRLVLSRPGQAHARSNPQHHRLARHGHVPNGGQGRSLVAQPVHAKSPMGEYLRPGAAGLAVFDEADNALLWVGMATQKLQTTMNVLGPDGAGHEGTGYWEYGVEHMLKLMQLADDLLHIDFHDSPWWKNAAQYSLYLSLPRSSWSRYNSAVNFADSPPHHWYGPDHILRHMAAAYNDGYAQWLADQIDTAEVESSNAQWLNLVWYKPSVAIRHPRTLPTLHHFTDMGIVSARTGWTGDENLVTFKCGPFIGHKAIMEFTYDPGGHHTHPDAGHFIVFAHGEWLFGDDGVGPKWTSRHNTLLIGGKGQLGEGGDDFISEEYLDTRARPRILTATSEPQYDHIAADVAPAYPGSMGLTRFKRHLLFIKPDVLVVLDDVLCASAEEHGTSLPSGQHGLRNRRRRHHRHRRADGDPDGIADAQGRDHTDGPARRG